MLSFAPLSYSRKCTTSRATANYMQSLFKDYKKLTTLIILCAKIQITSWYNDIKPQVTFLSPIPKWLLPQESWCLLACPTCSKCSLLLLHNMRASNVCILVVISGGEKISVRILGVVCCVCNLRLVRGKKQAFCCLIIAVTAKNFQKGTLLLHERNATRIYFGCLH